MGRHSEREAQVAFGIITFTPSQTASGSRTSSDVINQPEKPGIGQGFPSNCLQNCPLYSFGHQRDQRLGFWSENMGQFTAEMNIHFPVTKV